MTAEEWYQKGNAFRKESKWHEAINSSWPSTVKICIIPEPIRFRDFLLLFHESVDVSRRLTVVLETKLLVA